MPTTITERRIGDVTVLQLSGRIVLGDGAAELRSRMNDLVDEAHLKFLLDLRNVTYIDSSGTGELVSAYTTITNQGGHLKLLGLTHRVKDLLQELALLPESVLVVRGDDLVTEDDTLRDNDRVEIRPVMSGGQGKSGRLGGRRVGRV